MNLLDNLKMALFSIRSNKMRSFLTMLGIIIGISSVIMILGVGEGAKQWMIGSVEEIGATTVTLEVDGKNATEDDYMTFDDLEAIKQKVPHIKSMSPQYGYWGSVSYKTKDNDAVVYGCSNSFDQFAQIEMLSGRFFSEKDYLSQRNVVVIDEFTARKFFGNTNVVGMTVDVNLWGERMKLKVVGVSKNPNGSFYMEGQPFYLYMPLTTLFNNTGTDPTLTSVYIMSDGREYTEEMGNAARALLESRHGNRARNVYTVQSLMGQVDQMNSMLSIFTTFIGAVAAISLLVGGIGVMNIMLVAVTERTREIGIRKSLGAKTASIMQQFLTESVILTLIGGIIGLILGAMGADGISSVVSSLAGDTITPVVSFQQVLLALGFSSAVGIFFGIYPARKAARLTPIDALRHE